MTPRLALTTRSGAWAKVYSTSETTVVTTTLHEHAAAQAVGAGAAG